MMNFAISEYPPAVELRPFIQAYWQGRFNIFREQQYAQTVVPNGCIELIIHLSDAHCALIKHSNLWSKSPEFTLLGLFTKPYEVQFSDTVRVFGIRFFPDGIRNIFGVTPSEFLATFENSVDVFGQGIQHFSARIRIEKSIEKRLELANTYIKKQLELNYQSHDYTHIAMRLIRKATGLTGYRNLTSQVPISDRQLQREFKHVYGITVRDYMRLARMNAIQRYMQSGKKNLTQLSYDFDFTDQSHFIREFKNYIGMPPRQFLKSNSRFIVNPGLAQF